MNEDFTTLLAVICTDPKQNIITTLYHAPEISGDTLNLVVQCKSEKGIVVKSIPRSWVKYILVLNIDYDAQSSNINYSIDPRKQKTIIWAEGVHYATRNGEEIYLPQPRDALVKAKESIEVYDTEGKLLSADCMDTQVQNGYCVSYLKDQNSYVIINLSNVKLDLFQKV